VLTAKMALLHRILFQLKEPEAIAADQPRNSVDWLLEPDEAP
jgi:hypothetical protein